MAYVKWVANADRHNDWTSVLLLQDGTEVTMGVPIDLNADLQKELEGQGRIFEKSSKGDLDAYNERPEVLQPPGNDVLGTAPVFVNSGQGFNQTTTDQTEVEETSADAPKTVPAPARKS